MLLGLSLPCILPQMTEGKILLTFAEEGERLRVGSPLLEVAVDLSQFLAHDCPPVTYYRLVVREAATLRRWRVRKDEIIPVGAPLCVFSTREDPLDGELEREIRISLAGVVPKWESRLW